MKCEGSGIRYQIRHSGLGLACWVGRGHVLSRASRWEAPNRDATQSQHPGAKPLTVRCSSLIADLVVICTTCLPAYSQTAGTWPQWRGPSGTGVADGADPPTQWSATENIRWKTKLPGRGHSTPIVWGNRIFLTAAIPVGPKLPPKMSGRPGEHDNLPVDSEYRFVVIAIDRENGAVIWEKTVHQAVPIEGHTTRGVWRRPHL